jgi:hypothetical protein
MVLLAVVMTASCASPRQGASPVPARAASAARAGAVTHVVVCWLNDPNDAQAARKLVDSSLAFWEIPGVIRVQAGPRYRAPASRPIDDTSFDVAVVMTFDSPEALRAYQASEPHERSVREVLRPLTRRVVVYDFVDR